MLGAWPAAAQAAAVSVTPAIPAPGAQLTITAGGLPEGASGIVSLKPAGSASFRVDGLGRATAVLRVSRSARPGLHALRVRAGRGRVSTLLTVVSSSRPPSSLRALSGGQRVLLVPAEGAPGARLRVRGSGFRRRARVDVELARRPVAATRADARGRFSIAAGVPALAAGTHRLRVASGHTRVSLRFQVLGGTASSSPAPSAPSGAPATGPGPGPQAPPLPAAVPPGAPVVVAAAGDIACDPADPNFNGGQGVTGHCQQRATSDIVVGSRPDAVLGLGDMQYNAGALEAFHAVYGPTWGRVDPLMFPVPGNHEYGRPGAAGFFSYFGARAGTSGLGYYSFDLGSWHIVALNSNCDYVVCAPGSAQEQWLRADLAAHPSLCTLAFFHHPLFSSGQGEGDEPVLPFWEDLYAAGADLVLNGHSHNYERFAPQTPSGGLDTARGIREIVVGTGGDNYQAFLPGVAPNSERRSSKTFGVLQLTLTATGYSWQFRPAAGGSFTDSGSGSCH